MHLPVHPFWFWLIVLGPTILWGALWAVANYTQVPLNLLGPWLRGGAFLSITSYSLLFLSDRHKLLRLELWSMYGVCSLGYSFINGRASFPILRAPSKWPMPWDGVRFSILKNACIRVQDMKAAAPWYIDKLGLREVPNPLRDSGAQTYRFNEDGRSVTLTTKPTFGLDQQLILFTKKIGKMKQILSERGIEPGPFEVDRQGTRYFEIHDPEGNAIEVVEEI